MVFGLGSSARSNRAGSVGSSGSGGLGLGGLSLAPSPYRWKKKSRRATTVLESTTVQEEPEQQSKKDVVDESKKQKKKQHPLRPKHRRNSSNHCSFKGFFTVGDEVMHFKKKFQIQGDRERWIIRCGKIVAVHLDDLVNGVYYTVDLSGGVEIQAEERKLVSLASNSAEAVLRAQNYMKDVLKSVEGTDHIKRSCALGQPVGAISSEQMRLIAAALESLRGWASFPPPKPAKMDHKLAARVFDDYVQQSVKAIQLAESQLLLLRAQSYLEEELFTEALQDVDKVISHDPKCQDGHFVRSCALRGLGHSQDSEKAYCEAISLIGREQDNMDFLSSNNTSTTGEEAASKKPHNKLGDNDMDDTRRRNSTNPFDWIAFDSPTGSSSASFASSSSRSISSFSSLSSGSSRSSGNHSQQHRKGRRGEKAIKKGESSSLNPFDMIDVDDAITESPQPKLEELKQLQQQNDDRNKQPRRKSVTFSQFNTVYEADGDQLGKSIAAEIEQYLDFEENLDDEVL